MKKLFFATAAIFLLSATLFVSQSIAQPPPPPTGPPCWPPPCVPIDGGLSLFIAAGVAFGGRKLYKASKEKELKAKAE